MKKVIITEKAPEAIGPYSQAIEAAGFLFLSGQLPIDPSTGEFAGKDISSQTRQSLENIKAILSSKDIGMENIVKVNVFLKDMDDFVKMNQIYAEYFPEQCPARSAVQVTKLPKDALVEIECIALPAC